MLNWTFYLFFMTYFMSIFFMFSFFSLIIFWIIIELNLAIFLVLCKHCSKFNYASYNSIIFYFIVQSLGSVLMLTAFCSSSFINDMGMHYFSGFLLLSSLCFKLGMWPFYHWFFNFTLYSSPLVFFLILTFQKLPVFLFFLHIMDSSSVSIVLFSSFIFGTYILWFSKDFVKAMVGSSLYTMFWFYMGHFSSLSDFLVVFLLYSVSCGVMSLLKTNFFSFWSKKSFILSCSFIFLLGLPPFSFFFLKLNLILINLASLSFFLIGFIWLLTFVAFMGYFKNFFFLQIKEFLMYNFSAVNLYSASYFFLPFLFFF